MENKFLKEHLPLLLLLTVALAAVLITFRDYGESWDEYDIRQYADYSVAAYRFILHPQDLQPFHTNLNYYGPSFFMLAVLVVRFVTFAVPSIQVVEAWHLVYALIFLIGVLFLYLLARRWMSAAAAFGTALLFTAQPLLWGHAFINPKDIPFLTFFIASVHLGMKMIDASSYSATSRWPAVLTASLMLGLTISFRVVGPLAGALVFLYGLSRSPRWTLKVFVPYALLASLVAYLTWPYLWEAPVARLLESLSYMSRFPLDQTVLFLGELYPAGRLPWTFVPTLMRLQLTEPFLVLSLAGLWLSVVQFIRGKREPVLLAVFWFLLPAVYIIYSGSTLYDNFRQLFFLLPPLFILAGLALDWLFARFAAAWFRAGMFAVILVPFVVAVIQLHPYEYVYYNSFVGGVRGAFRDFEMDYWGTSFREAAAYINANVPQDASLVVFGPVHILRAYARPDLTLYTLDEAQQKPGTYPYVVLSTRRNLDQRRCPAGETLAVVEREDAVFAKVKQFPAGVPCR